MKIVYTPGCWDLLHIGHVRFLQEAAKHGRLIVGVPSDQVIQHDKGKFPIIPFNQRIEMLQALECVSLVEPYFNLWFNDAIEKLEPDVLAVGSQWGTAERHIQAEKLMLSLGGELIRIPYTEGISTTEIVQKIKETQ